MCSDSPGYKHIDEHGIVSLVCAEGAEDEIMSDMLELNLPKKRSS